MIKLHVERMENDRIGKRVYVREYTSSCSVGCKRLIDCEKKKRFGCQASKENGA